MSWFPTAAEGDIVVGKLTPLFKNGSSFLTDEDLKIYLAVYIASVVFFAIVYFLFETYFKISGSKMY